MFSNVNRKGIYLFNVLKDENVLHFSLEKYCANQKKVVSLPMIKDIISENGLHLGITSELDSALGLHRPCNVIRNEH